MISDDGQPILEPIAGRGNLCIFNEGDKLTLRKRHKGVIWSINKSDKDADKKFQKIVKKFNLKKIDME